MEGRHFCQSIRGALSNWRYPSDYKNVFFKGGKTVPPLEARDYLYDCLAEGKEVLPFGECDNFDYKKGCRGHESEE